PHAAGAHHIAARGGVVGDRVTERDLPVLDARVDQLDGRHDPLDRGRGLLLGAALRRDVGAEDEAHLDLDAREAEPGGLDRCALGVLHDVQEMTVVGLVDAHHLLHRLGRQAHLVAGDHGARVQLAPDVDELDLERVVRGQVRVVVGERGDRGHVGFGIPQSLRESGTGLLIEHERDATWVIWRDCRRFYNVFYMADQEFDVVVVGGGGAGMTAALAAAKTGLSVVLVEKAPHYGGSTARSGGGVWIPGNSVLRRDGVLDTPEAARTYLRSIIGDVVDPERID